MEVAGFILFSAGCLKTFPVLAAGGIVVMAAILIAIGPVSLCMFVISPLASICGLTAALKAVMLAVGKVVKTVGMAICNFGSSIARCVGFACGFVWKWSGLKSLVCGLGYVLHATIGRVFLYLARCRIQTPGELSAMMGFIAEVIGFVFCVMPVIFLDDLTSRIPGFEAVHVMSILLIVGTTSFGLGAIFWCYLLVKQLTLRNKVSPSTAEATSDDEESADKQTTDLGDGDKKKGDMGVNAVEVLVKA
jgi:hypothetical protein